MGLSGGSSSPSDEADEEHLPPSLVVRLQGEANGEDEFEGCNNPDVPDPALTEVPASVSFEKDDNILTMDKERKTWLESETKRPHPTRRGGDHNEQQSSRRFWALEEAKRHHPPPQTAAPEQQGGGKRWALKEAKRPPPPPKTAAPEHQDGGRSWALKESKRQGPHLTRRGTARERMRDILFRRRKSKIQDAGPAQLENLPNALPAHSSNLQDEEAPSSKEMLAKDRDDTSPRVTGAGAVPANHLSQPENLVGVGMLLEESERDILVLPTQSEESERGIYELPTQSISLQDEESPLSEDDLAEDRDDRSSRLTGAGAVLANHLSQLKNSVEARMVDEKFECDISRAEKVQKKKTAHRRSKRLFLAELAFAAVASAILLLFVFLMRGGSSSKMHKFLEESDETTNNTILPISAEEHVLKLLPNYTLVALEELLSPQSNAFDWLMKDEKLNEYEDWRVLQRFSLATLYFSLNGDHWRKNENWLDYGHECDWKTTSYYDAYEMVDVGWRLIGLNLEADLALNWLAKVEHEKQCEEGDTYRHLWLYLNNLAGTLPPELFLLTSLRSLGMSGEKQGVNGTISTLIGQLTSLEALGVVGGAITGVIPSQIGLLEQLFVLGFMYNQLEGTLPSQLGKLTKLEYIGLDSNKLTGTVPTVLGNLKSNVWCNLFSNQFTGTIPSYLGLMNATLALDLMDNELGGSIPPELGQLSNMQQLWLNDNSLSGEIPTELLMLPDLQILRLDRNQFTGTIPSGLCSVSTLEFDCGNGLCGCERCLCGMV